MDMVGVSMAPIVIILDLTITTPAHPNNREARQAINQGQPKQTNPTHPFRGQYKERGEG